MNQRDEPQVTGQASDVGCENEPKMDGNVKIICGYVVDRVESIT